MSKRQQPARIDPINLPRRLREGLMEADQLLEKKNPVKAQKILQELAKDFPHREEVLGLLTNACMDTNDRRGYLQAIRELHSLRPNKPEYTLGLAEGYLSNGYFFLALQCFERFMNRWPSFPDMDEIRARVNIVREGSNTFLNELQLEESEAIEFARKHDELRVCLDTGQFQRGKSLAREMLQVKPDFAPTRNNLSQIYWLEGENNKAIETCRAVLAADPDNIHALSNIIRLYYLSGQKEETPEFIKRLKESKVDAAEHWKKIAEVLSFIGDDQGMLELKAMAQEETEPYELDEYFHHYAAVSEAMLGREKEARKDWNQALKLQPGFSPAQENLDDLDLPKHERNGPWAHSLGEMIPEKIARELTSVVERAAKNKNEDKFQPAVRRFIDTRPEILQLASLILERGEKGAKEFVITVADISGHEKLLAVLKEFAFGQAGSDEMRMQAAQILSKHNAAPSGTVKLWLEGEWREIMLLGFEITPEPTFEIPLKPRALQLYTQAIEALREENWALAEKCLREALVLQPEVPSLLNNLALALSMQGKKEEGDALLKHISQDFPDYFFGQMSLARLSIHEKDYEKADAILRHWMETKKKFHFSEYNIFCKTWIDLLIAEDKLKEAFSWFEMLEQSEPDDPDLEYYKQHLELIQKIESIRDIPSRRKKQKKKE
jgi:tetratricopeptide (TPR) repeat protein